jgi:hypothetical protein
MGAAAARSADAYRTESLVPHRRRQCGCVVAGVLLTLALQPRLLIVEHAIAAIIAGVLILPFQPTFAAILAIGVVPLIAYPYWRYMRSFPSWWSEWRLHHQAIPGGNAV